MKWVKDLKFTKGIEMKKTHIRIGVIFLPTDCTGPKELHTIVNYCSNLIAQSVNCRFPKGIQELNKTTYEFALKYLPETTKPTP